MAIKTVGNKMQKAFPLLVRKFPLPEGTSHCLKKNATARRKVMPLPEDCTARLLSVFIILEDHDLSFQQVVSETPSLDNILTLSNQFEDTLGGTANSKESNRVEADTLVDCPKGVRPIGTKWVLKNKKDERGIVIKNKARLVAQGHTQEEGIDYDEVFALVARIEAIRLFLAYALFMDIVVYQMDLKSDFLYGTIDEEPPGFQDPDFPTKVCKVEKAMYGLHQAPRAWYGTLSKYLLKNGFKRGTINQTLFIRKQREDFILVQVYVDDIIFGSSNPQLCREFEAFMHENFQMSVMGELNFFLGLQVLQKEDGIFLSQDKYVGGILKKFGYTDVRSSNTLMDKENPWGKEGIGKDVDLHLYRSMIGSLMYLTASRPDILFVGHPKLGLWYPNDSPFDLVSFSDSDYDGATQDRKSTTRGCQFLGRRLISWQCKKQTIMATSTTEAKYVAATSCCGKVLWIQNQLLDYGLNMTLEAFTREFSTFILHFLRLIPLGKHNSDFHPMVDFLEASPLRARIAQSFALPPVVDQHASPVRDVSQGEACPTDSSFIADQDRATIAKSSTLPYDSAPRVTSLVADNGSMQPNIIELMVLCTSLQRQHSELLAKFQAQEVKILKLKERVKVLEDREGIAATRSGDDAPIKGRSMDEGEAATERISDDTEEMETVLTSIDAATREREDKRMSEQIARDVEVARIHAEEELQSMIDNLDKNNETIAKYLQEYQQFAAELPLERRIELISDLVKYQENYAKIYKFQSQQRRSWTKKQKRDYYMAVIRNNLGWKVKDFKGMTFEEVEAKFNSVYKQMEDFIPMGSKKEAERYKIKAIRFDQESSKKLKSSEEVIEEAKSTDEIPEEKIKEMMQLIPIKEVYVEALQVKHLIIDWKVHKEGQRSSACYQFFVDLLKHLDRDDLNQLWILVKEYLSIRPTLSDKEIELWVELKRLYEPDPEDQLWTQT
nr:putative ribonuclease H-like domain-containing protein [Tanacetum cinerariifolium]